MRERNAIPMIRHFIVAASLADMLFVSYLIYREIVHIRSTSRKEALGYVDIAEVAAYNLDKLRLMLVSRWVSFILVALVMLFDALNRSFSALGFSGGVFQQAVFAVIVVNVDALARLPIDVARDFYVERKHGLGKITPGTFVKDWLNSTMIRSAVTLVVSSVVLLLVESLRTFFFYAFVFITLFQVFLLFTFPYVQLLFNTFTELEEGELKEKIAGLAGKAKFNLGKIYVMDQSRRSTHSNAYITGIFGSKEIVLFDTLLDVLADEEVAAVVAHELGHYVRRHVYANLAIVAAHSLVFFSAMNLFLKGIRGVTIVRILVFLGATEVVDVPLTFAFSYLTRCMERSADAFAMDIGYGEKLATALTRLAKDNMSYPIPDPLFSSFFNTHPVEGERIEFIRSRMRKIK